MNSTVRRIDKTDTMIHFIITIIHRRPVGVDKVSDTVVGGPGVAYYNRSFSYVFLMNGSRFGMFQLPPSQRDTPNLRPVSLSIPPSALDMLSSYVPSNVVLSLRGKVGFVYFNNHTYFSNAKHYGYYQII